MQAFLTNQNESQKLNRNILKYENNQKHFKKKKVKGTTD